MSKGPNLAVRLESVGWEIQNALEGVEEFPGPHGTDIFAGEMAHNGTNVVIAMTKILDGRIAYHVRREKPADDKGYSEAFDYLFGDRDPEVVFSRFHSSHRFSRYTQPPFDVQQVRPMKKRDADSIEKIIGIHSMLRDSG